MKSLETFMRKAKMDAYKNSLRRTFIYYEFFILFRKIYYDVIYDADLNINRMFRIYGYLV